jgi:tetratricopeptide (TPR) repeat protein
MPKKASAQRKLTPGQRRHLDVEIGFLEGLVKRDPQYVEALQLLGDDYTRRGRVRDGLSVDQRLAGLCPDDPAVFYNLACSHSLSGEVDAAAAALDRAITLGFRDFTWISRDPDLKPLRQHPLYRKIRQRLKTLRGKATPRPRR